MKNVLDRSCGQNQNTHFMLNNLSPNIMPFMRLWGKTMEDRKWQYHMAHVLCMLDK
jgi:hypothetical protein